MAAVHEDGGEFQYSAVEGRLAERDRDRLAKLVFDKDRALASLDEGKEALELLRDKIDLERKLGMSAAAGR